MANTPFRLRSQGSSFKMMGSSPLKNDKKRFSLKGSGVDVGIKKSSDPDLGNITQSASLTPGVKLGNLSLNTEFTKGFTPTSIKQNKREWKMGETLGDTMNFKKIGGSLDYTFGGKDKAGFMGSIKSGGGIKTTKQSQNLKKDAGGGSYTLHGSTKKTKKPYHKSRLSLGFGKQAQEQDKCLPGSSCGSGKSKPAWNVMGFGERSNKGTSVGVSGKRGILEGEGKYNLKTKKPEFKLGLKFGI